MAKKKLTADTDPVMDTFNNSGMYEIQMKKLQDFKSNEILSRIFPIDERILQNITESMKSKGYDRSQPICIWKETGETVDGNTRLAAAEKAGLFEVPFFERSFKNIDEAKEYAFKRQADRRNLTSAEIYKAATELNISGDWGSGDKVEQLATDLGVSAKTIKRARAVEARADETTKNAVKSGQMSITAAYKKIKNTSPAAGAQMLDTGGAAKKRNDDGFGDISDSLEDISASAATEENTPADSTPPASRPDEPTFEGSAIIRELIAGKYTDAARALARSELFAGRYSYVGVAEYLEPEEESLLRDEEDA